MGRCTTNGLGDHWLWSSDASPYTYLEKGRLGGSYSVRSRRSLISYKGWLSMPQRVRSNGRQLTRVGLTMAAMVKRVGRDVLWTAGAERGRRFARKHGICRDGRWRAGQNGGRGENDSHRADTAPTCSCVFKGMMPRRGAGKDGAPQHNTASDARRNPELWPEEQEAPRAEDAPDWCTFCQRWGAHGKPTPEELPIHSHSPRK